MLLNRAIVLERRRALGADDRAPTTAAGREPSSLRVGTTSSPPRPETLLQRSLALMEVERPPAARTRRRARSPCGGRTARPPGSLPSDHAFELLSRSRERRAPGLVRRAVVGRGGLGHRPLGRGRRRLPPRGREQPARLPGRSPHRGRAEGPGPAGARLWPRRASTPWWTGRRPDCCSSTGRADQPSALAGMLQRPAERATTLFAYRARLSLAGPAGGGTARCWSRALAVAATSSPGAGVRTQPPASTWRRRWPQTLPENLADRRWRQGLLLLRRRRRPDPSEGRHPHPRPRLPGLGHRPLRRHLQPRR